MRAARRETLQKDVKIAREKARAALTRPALFAILFKLYRRGSILRAALRGELSEWSMVQHSKCSFSGLYDHVIFIVIALQFLLFSV